MIAERPLVLTDTEVYRDYWLIAFKRVEDGKTRYFELYDGHPLDIEGIEQVLRNHTIVTFNGCNYDVPMISLALVGASNTKLKQASDTIILDNMKPWVFKDAFHAWPPRYLDHIDLFEVAPGTASLKLYGGRMHSKRLQDLPIEPDASISPADRERLVTYCINDLDTTGDLLTALNKQLELRAQMSEEYGKDLRSKSDAQIAEAVIKMKIEQLTGQKIVRPEYRPATFNYVPPAFIQFETEAMRETLEMVKQTSFHVVDGDVELPKVLENAKIHIGNSTYRMGIGGLHSSEQSVAHYSDAEYVLIDRDVASYYPAIVLQCELYPKHLGKAFLTVYQGLVARRLAAKRAGNKVVAESLKIVCNSSFGKFGNRWSTLFSPDLLIQTTMTGQLALLMLIESLELDGIPVVSANTDGVVIKCPRAKLDRLNVLIASWEIHTGFQTEATEYESLFSRDVNSYIAVKPNGEVKLKGAYAPTGLAKNPTTPICIEAVIEHLRSGTPLEETIEQCMDVRKFLVVRRVNGGAVAYRNDPLPKNTTKRFMRETVLAYGWEQDGDKWVTALIEECSLEEAYEQCRQASLTASNQYLGRVVRWFYSTASNASLRYKTNNNKVAGSDHAVPMMELIEGMPTDIDYRHYVAMAREILMEVGVVRRPPPPPPRMTKRRLWELIEAFDAELEAV